MDLNSLKVFAEVVNRGSFSGASKALNMPVSTVSRKVSEFEESLGQKLMERSTRNLRLTEQGETLYQYAKRSVEEMEAGLVALEEKQDQVEGTLRIAMPPNFELAWDGLRDFRLNFPKVKVQLLGITREIDLINDHIDVAFQYGESTSPSAISRKVASMTPKLIASKRYIEQNGMPKSIENLKDFNCLARGNPNSDNFWTLNGEKYFFQAAVSSNEFSMLRFFVKNDMGIAQLPPYFCQEGLESGEFVQILPEVTCPEVDVHMIYATRKHLSRVVRTFLDFSLEYAGNHSEFWRAQ
ncbi:LysR family transcriptional regulator [Vibrio harveyi]|uniref:LysR family transcriptional regulator n=1 Tax=Vibrio harveyi TaxID=669 RepID=UPI001C96CD90|nr:LysR family transcriptional regulator [Vibrio harveyi]MBY6236866.1 LysR family transcriptional regulator [Vibrio harveyi]